MQSVLAVTIKGELSASEDITFVGSFEGTIVLPHHRFIAGKGALINASIHARTVTVDGRVEGHITADVLDVGPTGTVVASVIAPRLAVEDGATINGPVNTERARAAGNVARHRQAQGTDGSTSS
jgi:cytoskeletal protein CcmA (bactofilin family)